jgi:hypothetical protein
MGKGIGKKEFTLKIKKDTIRLTGRVFMDHQDKVYQSNELTSEELNKVIEQLCHSKAEEFKLLGYEHVTGLDVWQCVSSRYKKESPPLHQVVNDILSLKVTQFMNWITIQAYKS